MKIYTEVGDDIGDVTLIDHMGSDRRIVEAARVSFGGDAWDDERDAKLIKYLLKNGHTSPFEHCVITWRFTVPLFVRSQHHRHRTWAYNEVSRRYTSENLQFYLPKAFRSQHDKNRQASNNDAFDPAHPVTRQTMSERNEVWVREAVAGYEKMLEAGIAREQARMVLPQNLYTSYYGTVSLHNAFGFLRQRLDPHAQMEIRKVAGAMLEQLGTIFPVAVEAFCEREAERKAAA